MSVRQQALRPIQAPSLFQHGAYFSTSQAASPQSYTKNPTKPTNPPKKHSPSPLTPQIITKITKITKHDDNHEA